MAHNILQHDQMMYNSKNGKPWHGLGNASDGLATAEEMLKLANLNWDVKLQPVFVGDSVVDGYKAVVRDDTNQVLSIMKSRYQPLQNTEALNFFDPLVERSEAIYETAGSIKNGRTVFLVAKLPDYIQPVKGDLIEKYVLLTNSHDGSSPVIAKVTPVRVVCNNTLTLALKGDGQEVRVRHTKGIVDNLTLAHETLGLINKVNSQVEEIFAKMAKVQMNTESAKAYFEMVFNVKKDEDGDSSTRSANMIQNVFELVESGKGTDIVGVRGSLYGMYNALTEYVDHHKTYRTKTDRTDALLFGSGAKLKEKAFTEALSLM